jgi:hypothetical protein
MSDSVYASDAMLDARPMCADGVQISCSRSPVHPGADVLWSRPTPSRVEPLSSMEGREEETIRVRAASVSEGAVRR